ncbi:8801_t:CDS:2 [Diversispora eburnea]|uniref:8801_t:CDS:1 n=1 Tax=Diversispora eburnea TaxID=1213867 RepID=A0A9N9A3R0_9GLOM|nr:8801_t:CDS:2 [Diversispora eburnea]
MTRTKQNIAPGSVRQDRHFQSGILDPREGQHNWGKPTDEVKELPEDLNVRTAEMHENKLKVVDPKEFEILQNAAANLKEES